MKLTVTQACKLLGSNPPPHRNDELGWMREKLIRHSREFQALPHDQKQQVWEVVQQLAKMRMKKAQ